MGFGYLSLESDIIIKTNDCDTIDKPFNTPHLTLLNTTVGTLSRLVLAAIEIDKVMEFFFDHNNSVLHAKNHTNSTCSRLTSVLNI